MKLQENIQRIKEVMGIINEQYPNPVNNLGNINWTLRFSQAGNIFMMNMWKMIEKEHGSTPKIIDDLIDDIMPDNKGTFFNLLLNDINKGSLSQKTIDNFRSEFIFNINEILKDTKITSKLKELPPKLISIAKMKPFRLVIKWYIDKYYKLLGNEFFIKGLLGVITRRDGDVADKRILNNTKKVLNELSYSITNDSKLKNDIYELGVSFVSKL